MTIHGYVSLEKMPELFGMASAYFDPSLFEGFGMQILEAMACGTPVVTSSVSSIPEIAGGAAVLRKPLDVNGFAKALTDLLTSEEQRKLLAEKGRERASGFRWEIAVPRLESLLASMQ